MIKKLFELSISIFFTFCIILCLYAITGYMQFILFPRNPNAYMPLLPSALAALLSLGIYGACIVCVILYRLFFYREHAMLKRLFIFTILAGIFVVGEWIVVLWFGLVQ